MIKAAWIAATGLALATASSGVLAQAKPVKAAAVQRDWTQVVTRTPAGTFLMGNPRAKVKLTEYGSLTCSHCAHFDKVGYGPLTSRYVRSGQVAYEFRNHVRDPYDLAATLVTRCGGTGRFFAMTHNLFDTQNVWMERAQNIDQARLASLNGKPPQQTLPVLADLAGLKAFGTTRGLTKAQLDACLSNKPAIDRLVALTKDARETRGVTGTPSFDVNGQRVTISNPEIWPDVEAALKAALAG
jgi:protein-disulfide isomerase